MCLHSEIDDLRAKLSAAESKQQLMESRERVRTLETIKDQLSGVIKENTALLIKQRLPSRPYLNWTAKALIAQEQGWCCVNPNGDCPLYKLGDGRFGKDLYEIDHVEAWSKSGRHSGNLRALCSCCHAVITRQQIARQEGYEEMEQPPVSGLLSRAHPS